MELIKAFIPLMTLWLLMAAVSTICSLAVAAYRKKGLPELSPVACLIASSAALYVANEVTFSAFAVGVLLFGSGQFSFSACLWSAEAMKEAGKATTNEKTANTPTLPPQA